jgi:hypothetical protein
MKTLVIDVGGTHVKILATGEREHRQAHSGPKMTDALAAKLQRDGADAFVASWQELLACLVDKSQALKKAG